MNLDTGFCLLVAVYLPRVLNLEGLDPKLDILVQDDTVHKVDYGPPFGIQGSLIFDIAIASYIITHLFIYFLYFILQVQLQLETRRGTPHPHPHPIGYYWYKRKTANGPRQCLLRELLPGAKDPNGRRNYVSHYRVYFLGHCTKFRMPISFTHIYR